MESLLVKIFALALALSQVTTTPDAVKTQFDRTRDQEEVARLLGAGCTHMRKAFDIEDINLDELIATAMDDPQVMTSENEAFRGINFADLQTAYRQFCENEKVPATPTSAQAQWRRAWHWAGPLLRRYRVQPTLTAMATRPIPMAMAPLTATRVLAMAPVPKATRVMATAILPTATPATAIRGMVMAAATIRQPIAPSTMAVIDQRTVPPSTEAIGSPAALRSTALVGAEPLVRNHLA